MSPLTLQRGAVSIVIGNITGHCILSTYSRRSGLAHLASDFLQIQRLGRGGDCPSPAKYMFGFLPKEKYVLWRLLNGCPVGTFRELGRSNAVQMCPSNFAWIGSYLYLPCNHVLHLQPYRIQRTQEMFTNNHKKNRLIILPQIRNLLHMSCKDF